MQHAFKADHKGAAGSGRELHLENRRFGVKAGARRLNAGRLNRTTVLDLQSPQGRERSLWYLCQR